MAKQSIFLGTSANDGTGSNLRAGGTIINQNFDEIYSNLGDGTNLKGYINFLDSTSTVYKTNIGAEFKFIGGAGIDATISGMELNIAVDSTVPTNTSTATLTNKTLDLSTNTITGTTENFNTALSDGSFTTLAGSETLTNKSIDLSTNTITGTTANFNTALSDDDFATLAGTETLTNKTIDTSLNTISGSLFTVADDTSTTSSITQGDVLKVSGGDGITTTVSGDEVTVTASGITNAQLSGTAGISNANLAEDSVTIGYTAVALGSSATTVNGLSITGSAYIQISGSGSSIRFNHANLASFPAYATFAGSPALDETTLKPYMATSSGWVELLTENSSVADISNVSLTGIANGEGLIWNSSTTKFEPGSVGGSGASTLTVADSSSTQEVINLSNQVLTFQGGTGITTTVNPAFDSITISNTGVVAGSDVNHDFANINDLGYIGFRSPDNTVTKTLTVTTSTKADDHYYYGDGHSSGFYVDGKSSPALTLAPGKYKFDMSDSSNSGHPLKFYREADKTTEYSVGVTLNGTAGNAGAYTEIDITDDTPNTLYYQCADHPYMGHVLKVVGGRSKVISDKSNTGDGSTTTFTINNGRTVDDILVFVNGICLVPADDYQVSTTNLTFTLAPAVNAEIVIRYIS